MIANVVLTNACLAFSSIQFYQISRVLITPCVALLNYLTLGATIPRPAALALVPVCVGVGIVSYFDAAAKGSGSGSGSKDTSPLGVAFAFTGVFASSVYTVWIGKYHKMLDCTSMQLLLIQSPVSILIMVYVIPFSDDPTVWRETTAPTWGLMALVSYFHPTIALGRRADSRRRAVCSLVSSTLLNSSSLTRPARSAARLSAISSPSRSLLWVGYTAESPSRTGRWWAS